MVQCKAMVQCKVLEQRRATAVCWVVVAYSEVVDCSVVVDRLVEERQALGECMAMACSLMAQCMETDSLAVVALIVQMVGCVEDCMLETDFAGQPGGTFHIPVSLKWVSVRGSKRQPMVTPTIQPVHHAIS
jgi:hypothetical protein